MMFVEHFQNPHLMMGLILYFASYIFLLNGLNMMGKISAKEIAIWNFMFSAFMITMLLFSLIFQLWGEGTWINACGTFLFAFTFLGIGLTNILQLEGKGLGWYCLLVAVITPFFAQMNFSLGDWRFGIIWLLWGVMWFIFFLILGLDIKKLAGKTFGTIMVLVAIFTLWIPAYSMLRGWW